MRRMYSEKQLEEIIEPKLALKADKVTIDSIEWDSESNTLIFPEGVMPLRIQGDDGREFFFDYKNLRILYDDGTNASGSIEWNNDTKQYSLTGFTALAYPLSNCQYINVVEVDDGANRLNTYYIWNPQLLYKHDVIFDENGDYYVSFVSTRAAPYTNIIELINDICSDSLNKVIPFYSQGEHVFKPLAFYSAGGNNFDAVGIDDNAVVQMENFEDLSYIEDDVSLYK